MQKRILVVDDDEVNLMRTKRILEKNYDVILVESGAEALNTIKSEKIDLRKTFCGHSGRRKGCGQAERDLQSA